MFWEAWFLPIHSIINDPHVPIQREPGDFPYGATIKKIYCGTNLKKIRLIFFHIAGIINFLD